MSSPSSASLSESSTNPLGKRGLIIIVSIILAKGLIPKDPNWFDPERAALLPAVRLLPPNAKELVLVFWIGWTALAVKAGKDALDKPPAVAIPPRTAGLAADGDQRALGCEIGVGEVVMFLEGSCDCCDSL